jgi:hypothetical protein
MADQPSKNEEEYFAQREAELLRQQRATAQQAAAEAERRSHRMKCPGRVFRTVLRGVAGKTAVDP